MSIAVLIAPVFIAGMLMALAPCTLPLVPAYLAFISGYEKKKILRNALYYILGFSVVFIFFGIIFGLGGAVLGQYRAVLARIGGIFIVFFGLSLMSVFSFKVPFIFHNGLIKKLKPGNPLSSFVFGSVFAFGWSPCIGPVLGTVLLFAATAGTIVQGAFLLTIFSLGMAVPFFLIALGVDSVTKYIKKISRWYSVISFIGGAFLVFLGILMVFNRFNFWVKYLYGIFNITGYDRLLDYL